MDDDIYHFMLYLLQDNNDSVFKSIMLIGSGGLLKNHEPNMLVVILY